VGPDLEHRLLAKQHGFKARAELEMARKQKLFLRRGVRGTDAEFRDIGVVYLPIPRCD
jgi:hypothetical protein